MGFAEQWQHDELRREVTPTQAVVMGLALGGVFKLANRLFPGGWRKPNRRGDFIKKHTNPDFASMMVVASQSLLSRAEPLALPPAPEELREARRKRPVGFNTDEEVKLAYDMRAGQKKRGRKRVNWLPIISKIEGRFPDYFHPDASYGDKRDRLLSSVTKYERRLAAKGNLST